MLLVLWLLLLLLLMAACWCCSSWRICCQKPRQLRVVQLLLQHVAMLQQQLLCAGCNSICNP
jgi:hypothetical protein